MPPGAVEHDHAVRPGGDLAADLGQVQARGRGIDVGQDEGGADGFVSLEVEPGVAHDTDATTKQARDLWGRVNRPNLMIKIPGTLAGGPAIASLNRRASPGGAGPAQVRGQTAAFRARLDADRARLEPS